MKLEEWLEEYGPAKLVKIEYDLNAPPYYPKFIFEDKYGRTWIIYPTTTQRRKDPAAGPMFEIRVEGFCPGDHPERISDVFIW